MPRTTIDNGTNTIDSRDIIERIEELREMRDQYEDGEEFERENREEASELHALEMLQDEAQGYASDWRYGVTLVRDSYFPDYVQSLLVDCDVVPPNLPWYVVVDWDATADNVRQDYTEVDFGGVTYLVR